MKKMIFALLYLSSLLVPAQKKNNKNSTNQTFKKYTLEQAEKSNNTKVLANFIANHPNHPKTQILKQRLTYLMNQESKLNAHHKKIPTKKIENMHSSSSNIIKVDGNHTTEILNHILNGDTKSTRAYVLIKNDALCDIIVDIKGKYHYQVNLKAGKEGRLLIDKGSYQISSIICNASYNAIQQINSDFQIRLNNK